MSLPSSEGKRAFESRSYLQWANDASYVFWDRLSLNDAQRPAARNGEYWRLFTHHKVKLVCVPDTTGAGVGAHQTARALSVFDQLHTMAYLAISAQCQQIVTAGEEAVRKGLELQKLSDVPNLLNCLRQNVSNGDAERAVDFARLAAKSRILGTETAKRDWPTITPF